MSIFKRIFTKTQDPSAISNHTYNEAAGAQKNTEVGRHLLPLPDGSSGFTTNAATVLKLPKKGANLAIYNNSSTLYAITMGSDNTVTAQASGAIQAGTQNVGIPCKPNDWTYVACNTKDWIITQNSALLVFLIDDDTMIVQEASR